MKIESSYDLEPVISNNRENPTFFPAIDQLREFREKLKEVS